MRISKTILWTMVGAVAMSGVGLVISTVRNYHDKLLEKEFEQQELQTLEGEGGICLN